MRILLTNDDGIHAPGLEALEQAARKFGEVITVAPVACHSGCGHQTTTTRPLRISEHGPARFAVDGTPADCVRLALLHLAPDVDCVLAGVNSGGNLGVDTYLSGTVAAGREAMLLGRRSLAFSQYRKTRDFNAWEKASRMVVSVLPDLLNQAHEAGTYWNINLPDEPGDEIPPRVICPVDPHPLSFTFEQVGDEFHYRSNYHGRARHAEHDIDVCFSGRIAISQIRHG